MSKANSSAAIQTQASLNSQIWNTCNILRRSNCAGAMQYVPELTWLLFLRILDEREIIEQDEADALGLDFVPTLRPPYRWQDWAATPSLLKTAEGDDIGWKRRELAILGSSGDFFSWVNTGLLPHLKDLRNKPNATARQKVISEALSGVERVRVDTERNFLDVFDRVHLITLGSVDQTHIFTLSQVYEGLLLKMGEKGNDGGQFFTPREVIRAMVRAVSPKSGETIYDPCCGTGGFLAQAFDYMKDGLSKDAIGEQLEILKHRTFYGREKENLIYPIALANLTLHGIDEPHLWHGNTLTGGEVYGGLWHGAPSAFDVILTNPPFGGKEGKEAQTQFSYKTGATTVLFLQHIIDNLRKGGRAGVVVDEGVLFRTNEQSFVQTKRKLLDECNVWSIVSLPGGAFANAGAGVKTNILFFTKEEPTKDIWYYDLSDLKMGKKSPLTLANFEGFFKLLPQRANSDRSWTVTRKELEARNYDLKAVNPNAKTVEDTRTPEELLDLIEAKGHEVAKALAALRVAGH